MATSHVTAPPPSRGWIIPATAACLIWVACLVSNTIAAVTIHDGIPTQLNALGASLGGSLTVVAGVLYAVRVPHQERRARSAQVERIETQIAANTEAVARLGLGMTQMGTSYTNLLCQVNPALSRPPTPVPGQRRDRNN